MVLTTPSPPMVDIWHIELNSLMHMLEPSWELLAPKEKARALEFKFMAHKNAFILYRASLRNILSCYLNQNPKTIELKYTQQGKPYIKSQDSLFFNLTHTQQRALLAVSKTADVGIDIEYKEPKIDVLEMAQQIMAACEYRSFCALNPQQQIDNFYIKWVRKEAFIKCLGLGFSYDVRNCFILKQANILKVCQMHKGSQQIYAGHLQDIQLADNTYCAALMIAQLTPPILQTYHYTPTFGQL